MITLLKHEIPLLWKLKTPSVPELPYCAYISKLSYIIYTNMTGTDKNIFHFAKYLVPTTLWKDSTAHLFHNCLWLLKLLIT
jgi:hypothetical protein